MKQQHPSWARRISCSQGKHTTIRSLGVPGGRCVGGVGGGGVGEEGVEVVEVAELVCTKVAGVVAAELCRHVGVDSKDGVCRANCRVS